MSYEASEIYRQMANLLRIGTVAEVDTEAARVRISASGLTTDWLPWLTARAGGTRVWSPPQVGEQVLLVSPYGDLGQAIVIGSLFYDDRPPPATSSAQDTVLFADGSTVDYNSESNTLTVNVVGAGNVVINCQVATVKAEERIDFDTPEARFTGNMLVDGDFTAAGSGTFNGGSLTHNGKNVGGTHTHPGVERGSGTTDAPT